MLASFTTALLILLIPPLPSPAAKNAQKITVEDVDKRTTKKLIGTNDDNKTMVYFLPIFEAKNGLKKLAEKFPMA